VSRGRPKKQYELHIDGQYDSTGTVDELARMLGLKPTLLYKRVDKEIYGILLKPVEEEEPVYAFYKGEDGPFIGTIAEISKMTGIEQHMIEWYGTPSASRRHDTALIKMEDESMITRRTINKVAPVPVPEKYDGVAVKKQITVRPAAEKQFKVGEYAQYLHDAVFANWNLKEGR